MAEDLPEKLRLTVSKKRTVLLLGLCLIFVALGVWLIKREATFGGWLCVVFFGSGVIVAAAQFLPDCSYLELEREGFTMCSLFRKRWYKWNDIEKFIVRVIKHNKMVRQVNAGRVDFQDNWRLQMVVI